MKRSLWILVAFFSSALSSTLFFQPHDAIKVKSEDLVVCPGGKSECPSGSTCCALSSGDYGCCPIPKAVCCSDHLHCCPEGSTCDVSEGKCQRGHVSLPWYTKLPATSRSQQDVICPDGQSTCPSGSTCCQMQSGQYGCCPLPSAVCCSDHLHCCPEGSTCDVSEGKCQRGHVSLPWYTKLPSTSRSQQDVICPDGQSTCPSGSTCCKMQSGQYGCCPLPSAVCCSDHLHCCPEGSTCDVSEGKCQRGHVSLPWHTKLPATSRSLQDVICPDGQSTCPSGSTCCQMQSGQYGCCPLPSAVCCSDHLHCCPEGSTCDVSEGKCQRGHMSLPWYTKLPSTSRSQQDVICPDGQSTCPSGSTCCQMQSGQYGCCPLPEAVCCSDHLHCCPAGTTCDTAAGKCNLGQVGIPWSTKMAASRSRDVLCPGGKSSCPDGTTCCMMKTGIYGCCPFLHGTCCADKVHCCPSGLTCSGSGQCVRSAQVTSAMSAVRAGDIICPGGEVMCPDGATCCRMLTGNYGCCPLPKAVCCADDLHCCPGGTTCDTRHEKCLRRDGQSVAWSLKSLPRSVNLQVVVCPDRRSTCPTGSTCCKTVSGKYGCCPLLHAVCCADDLHCCPGGTTCDTRHEKCLRRDGQSVAWSLKSLPRSVNLQVVVCPDRRSTCPTGSTCCKTVSGKYGCCPLLHAVCCSDGVHCCPSGSQCDVSHGKCKLRNGESVSWYNKQPELPGYAIQAKAVICPDGKSQCPSGTSCCQLTGSSYGCCPYPKGSVCCKDHIHCCPPHYKCNLAKASCDKMGIFHIPFAKSTMIASSPLTSSASSSKPSPIMATAQTVQCPNPQFKCPDQNTCCMLSSGHWGCCPLPKAVCCADELHCCPHGTTCDLVKAECSSAKGSMPWFVKKSAMLDTSELLKMHALPMTTTSRLQNLGDQKRQCPQCPITNAICCKDDQHCCPEDTQCDVTKGMCIKRETSAKWQAVYKPEKQDVTLTKTTNALNGQPGDKSISCPGSTFSCPDQTTCCKAKSGVWVCCPLAEAVCCKDGIHCCPPGYSCDLRSASCRRQDYRLPWLIEKQAQIRKTEHVLPESPNVICPDQREECPAGNTCCLLQSGDYGCCPLLDAVCCADGIHCCPQGYTCDAGTGACRQGAFQLPWLMKQPTLKRKIGQVSEDIKSTHGTYMPLAKKIPARTRITTDMLQSKEAGNSIKCPDGKSMCPSETTCCMLPNKAYGCCPMVEAVCCKDHIHCCPEGSTCDLAKQRCIVSNTGITLSYTRLSKSLSVSWMREAERGFGVLTSIECPDHQHKCPSASTCCRLLSGRWGCCPLPDAVCCSDGDYCCPRGYICHLSMCFRGNSKIPAVKRKPAILKTDGQKHKNIL